ncbi:hypothetical protein CPC08DRAFT_763569 [Agrocybe pediades]|nr:hypothetical protein CPC08DRAFT_763569 [Agrocybe pediades]
MLLRLLPTLVAAHLLAISFAKPQSRSSEGTTIRRKRNWDVYPNSTLHRSLTESPAELEKRDGTKYVFMHHTRKITQDHVDASNTEWSTSRYPYTSADWLDDMVKIAAKGVDAIALNIGGSEWQRGQIDSAYAAAQASGTGIKLFYSFDLTEMDCNLGDLVTRVNRFANHPAQFKINGKVMISSYAGDCLGHAGWASLKQQTNGYLMPFIWGLEGTFNEWPELDSWYCWGCAWPQGNYPKNTDDDNYYMSQLGNRYATTVSNWLYTHLSYKNFYLRGDDWLVVSRWEQLMQMRDRLTFVEMVTWNDYGESNYFGPVKGAQPAGTTWASNYPHTAWYDMTEYYITAFKTGVYPAIKKDVIYFWARPHPAGATASGDSLGKPTGWDWTEDSMWAAVFAAAPATVVLECGSSTNTFQVNPGVNKIKIPLSPGKMTVQMSRNGQTIINYTPNDYTYISNPVLYNYNAWVGSATATGVATSSSASSSSSPTSTTASSTTSSTLPSGTPTPGWTYQDSSQTIAKCLARCQAGSFGYAGVEYGVECFCANSLKAGAETTSESECNMPCAGKADEKCGAGYRINVYKAGSTSSTSSSSSSITSVTSTTPTITTTSTSSTSSAPTATSMSWNNYGCVAEGTTDSRRALTGASFSQTNMTPQVCQNLCAGYLYAGVEYGVQCYCGNSLTNNGATGNVISSSNCQSTCGGDPSQKCGGSWTMNVYTKVVSSSWSSAGCYVDASTRMLRGSGTTITGMTIDKCISVCSSGGYSMAATEYGRECYCGNQLYKEGGGGNPASAAQCNVPCEGNTAQICGGSWRGNLYLKPGTAI